METLTLTRAAHVTYVDEFDKCDSKIAKWYYMLPGSKVLYSAHQVPGMEATLINSIAIAVWAWDGSWSNIWQILIEAVAMGANPRHVKLLAEVRGCDNENAILFAKEFNIKLQQGAEFYFATRHDYDGKDGGPIGYGQSYLEAMAALCVELGFIKSKHQPTLRFLQLIK